MRKALEQLKLMINSYDLDDDDIIYFCQKVISEIRKEQWEKEPQPVKASSSGKSILDAAYTPLAINNDYFLATTADEPGYNADAIDDGDATEDYIFSRTVEGRGSKVTELPGGEATGEIADLIYFSHKLRKGIRVPASYLDFLMERHAPAGNDTLGEIDE